MAYLNGNYYDIAGMSREEIAAMFQQELGLSDDDCSELTEVVFDSYQAGWDAGIEYSRSAPLSEVVSVRKGPKQRHNATVGFVLPADQTYWDWVSQHENKNGYILGLIREDMKECRQRKRTEGK